MKNTEVLCERILSLGGFWNSASKGANYSYTSDVYSSEGLICKLQWITYEEPPWTAIDPWLRRFSKAQHRNLRATIYHRLFHRFSLLTFDFDVQSLEHTMVMPLSLSRPRVSEVWDQSSKRRRLTHLVRPRLSSSPLGRSQIILCQTRYLLNKIF